MLEHEDVYEGEVLVERGATIPHGRGTLTSAAGQHCYVGDFVHRWRDGYGKLVTARFVLWCKWRMNRPDLTGSARVDYPNGDRYSGFLSLQQSSSPSSGPRLSRFSHWVLSTVPVRHRWGELVYHNGDRYFGEWEADTAHGFGCYTTRAGDRYVGRFLGGRFHDTGALFMTSYLFEGKRHMEGVGLGLPTPHLSRTPSLMCVLDGVWAKGRFTGEGHVTLPNEVRITAEWKSATEPYEGEVVFPSNPFLRVDDGAHRWREGFHWEPLLGGMFAGAKQGEYVASAANREELAQSPSWDAKRHAVTQFLLTNGPIRNALRIFRRCFYHSYGSCGASSEIGSGDGACWLGWCGLRNAFGGCIHQGRGRPITARDLKWALLDILSLTRSVQRWVAEMLGVEHEETLNQCGAAALVGRWTIDEVLRDVHDVLLNLYIHVYSQEDDCLSTTLAQMRGCITLDDMGVQFARRHHEERLFHPYADAIHCLEQLNAERKTLSGKLRVLLQWSRDIDVSTRLAQACVEDASLFARSGGIHSQPQHGSVDDLLPIHQYVLSQSRVQHLYAHTRLLVDLAGEADYIEPSSQECFCVTTLQVCVLTLPRLHQLLKDKEGVLVPAAFFVDQMASIVEKATSECEGPLGEWVLVARGYIKAWVPHLLTTLAGMPPLQEGSTIALCGKGSPIGEEIEVIPLGDGSLPPAARLVCFGLAGSLLACVGLPLYLETLDSSLTVVNLELDYAFLAPSLPHSPQLFLRPDRRILPSLLLHAAHSLLSRV